MPRNDTFATGLFVDLKLYLLLQNLAGRRRFFEKQQPVFEKSPNARSRMSGTNHLTFIV